MSYSISRYPYYQSPDVQNFNKMCEGMGPDRKLAKAFEISFYNGARVAISEGANLDAHLVQLINNHAQICFIKMALDLGANPNQNSGRIIGGNLLDKAISENNHSLVDLLKRYGATPSFYPKKESKTNTKFVKPEDSDANWFSVSTTVALVSVVAFGFLAAKYYSKS